MAIGAKEWRLTRRRDTPKIVGNFFNHMIAAMIGGKVMLDDEWEFADAYSLDLGIRVEVKARNSGNPFGIGIHQKESYRKCRPPGIKHTLYGLVSYNPKGPRDEFAQRENLLRISRTRSSKYALLARKVGWVFLLDMPIIDAMERKYGVTDTGVFVGREGESTLKIRRREHLARLRNDFPRRMRALGLDPNLWILSRNRIGFNFSVYDKEFGQTFESEVELNLITILRRHVHRRIIGTLLNNALTLK